MKCGFLGLMVMCWVGLQSFAQGPGFWINRSRPADSGQARSSLSKSRFWINRSRSAEPSLKTSFSLVSALAFHYLCTKVFSL